VGGGAVFQNFPNMGKTGNRTPPHKKFTKSGKIFLDKSKILCYNIYIIQEKRGM
jgi:hypothetical protein